MPANDNGSIEDAKKPLVESNQEKPFKVSTCAPWWILINPLAWVLWILDFAIWLISICLPIIFCWWLVKWPCACCGIDSFSPEDAGHEGDDEDVDDDARRREKLLWSDGLEYAPRLDDHDEEEDAPKTGWEIAEHAFANFHENNALGTRTFVGYHTPDGAKYPIKVFGETVWQTYDEMGDRVRSFGAGLRALGMEPQPEVTGAPGSCFEALDGSHTMLIYEETCADWLTGLLGAFSQSIAVATSYATLGISAVVEAINECNIEVILCNYKDVEKLAKAAKQTNLKHIIYTRNCVEEDKPDLDDQGRISVNSFDAIVELGHANGGEAVPPSPDTMAVVMYTSGSTGKPKGVMITHSNIAASVAGLLPELKTVCKPGEETYIAYLPAAHILELTAELLFVFMGAELGFACPKTITSKGAVRQLDDGTLNTTAGWPNPPGGIQEFKPTCMAAVPVIWDIMKKGVEEAMGKRSCVVRFLFQTAFSAKYFAVKSGRKTPLFHLILFKTLASMLGGRMKIGITGGGPISGEVQSFIRCCFCFNLIQGYALTETCCAGTCQKVDDVADGVVGGPVSSVEIKLRSTEPEEPTDQHGEPYLASDEHHYDAPCLGRGEVCIRGPSVSQGYYKQPDKTQEVFDSDGWFRSGDIGVWDKRGRLMIVDRLKNLIKLRGGEYIALEAMEKEYGTSPYVNGLNGGVMCHGDGDMDRPIAFVQANVVELQKWAKGIPDLDVDDMDSLCASPEAEAMILKALQDIGKKRLAANEVVGAVRLIAGTGPMDDATPSSPWTPENGFRTASNKLNRKPILDAFQDELPDLKKQVIR